MNYNTDTIRRLGHRTAMITVPLLVAATGTAAAHSGGGYGGGMMGGGMAGGAMGGTMGLWGLLWLVLLIGVPVLLVYVVLTRESTGRDAGPDEVLRERYARGDLSDEEFESRRAVLERGG